MLFRSETLRSIGFLIKMMKSDFSEFIFEFFPHSIDLLMCQDKLQKLLNTSFILYQLSPGNMADVSIGSNITQYIGQVRGVLPAETLGYSDTGDTVRKQSQELSRRCGNNPSQVLDPSCFRQNAIDNKTRRRGGNFVYRKTGFNNTSGTQLCNSSVKLDNSQQYQELNNN